MDLQIRLWTSRLDPYDLGQSYLSPIYLIYSSTITVITVVTIVLKTSLFSPILIVLIVRMSYCLSWTFPLSMLPHCTECRYFLFPVIYCAICRTIVWTCISSVACTPWYCSSLNCSARCSITALLA